MRWRGLHPCNECIAPLRKYFYPKKSPQIVVCWVLAFGDQSYQINLTNLSLSPRTIFPIQKIHPNRGPLDSDDNLLASTWHPFLTVAFIDTL